MFNFKFSQKILLKDVEDSYIGEKTLLGNRYNVFNAVMLVPGVHSGTGGPMLFTDKVIDSNLSSWDGRPVLEGHPETDESSSKPQILDKYFLGNVFNPIISNGSLGAEVWLSKNYAKDIISLLSNGKNIDVSVGIWADVEPQSGTYNNEDYTGVITRYVPDHLAILVDNNGACSWDDGCGIRKVLEKEKEMECVKLIRKSARMPTYDGIEEISWTNVEKTFDAFVDGYYKHNNVIVPDVLSKRVSTAPESVKRWIANRTLFGELSAEDTRDLVFFPVVNPDTNKLNGGALRAVLSGRGVSADISEEIYKSAQEMARELLDNEFRNDNEVKMEKEKEIKTEMIEDNTNKQQEIEKSISLDEILSILDGDAKKIVEESLELRKQKRTDAIDDIKKCKKVVFCDKFLDDLSCDNLLKISELSIFANITLTNIADNINTENSLDETDSTNTVDGVIVDFSLKTPAAPKSKTWAPMPEINWGSK